MIIETTALISIGTWIGTKISDKGFDEIFKKVTSKEFDQKFYEKVNNAAKELQKDHPDALGGNIEYLFKHEDVINEIIKILFVDAKINIEIIEEKFDNRTLPDTFLLEFFSHLREELHKDHFFREILENKKLFLTIIGINKNLKEFLQVSKLTADEISDIKSLLEEKFKNNFSLKDFLKEYRNCVINNYSKLNFIGLGLDLSIKRGKKKKLEELYVEPTFSLEEKDFEKWNKSLPHLSTGQTINLKDIFNVDDNLVILGNPGSGKSILTKFITLKILQKDHNIFSQNEILDNVVFRIELRKYHAFKKEEKEGIIKYLRNLIELEFGNINLSIDNLNHILNNCKSLIIFDGLDEIFDITEKHEITNDIENFIAVHNQVKVIVTSRFIGYDDAALKEESVTKLTINEFNDEQVVNYIRNWYTAEEENETDRNKEINDLISKKNLISQEIISNPLLLSLIVILYRNNLKVPESKLEIYQSCTKTLVDKWDHSKNLKISLPETIYKRKDAVFADLAYWQYKELSTKEGKITYSRAKNTVAKSLTEKLKEVDEYTCDIYAEQFLEYAQNRSLYFDNNFTHKTFLEYFTAFWIFSNIEKKHKKKQRDELIEKYVTSSYWHIVLELLINLIDKDQADNEIIDDLIIYQLEKNIKSAIFFLQVFKGIQNVSISIYDRIVDINIELLLENYMSLTNEDKISYRDRFSSSFFVLAEHYEDFRFKERIESIIKSKIIQSPKDNNLLSLYLELNKATEFRKNREEIQKESDELLNKFDSTIIKKDPWNYIINTLDYCSLDFKKNPTTYAKEFLELFGVSDFKNELSAKFSNIGYIPFITICFGELLKNKNPQQLKKFVSILNDYKITPKESMTILFKFPFFNLPEKNLKQLLKNFNSIEEPGYVTLLIPMMVFVRFRRTADSVQIKGFQNDLEILNNKTVKRHLNYILDLDNDRDSVHNYINKKLKLDPNNVRFF